MRPSGGRLHERNLVLQLIQQMLDVGAEVHAEDEDAPAIQLGHGVLVSSKRP
jgi:hypothetical protein